MHPKQPKVHHRVSHPTCLWLLRVHHCLRGVLLYQNSVARAAKDKVKLPKARVVGVAKEAGRTCCGDTPDEAVGKELCHPGFCKLGSSPAGSSGVPSQDPFGTSFAREARRRRSSLLAIPSVTIAPWERTSLCDIAPATQPANRGHPSAQPMHYNIHQSPPGHV